MAAFPSACLGKPLQLAVALAVVFGPATSIADTQLKNVVVTATRAETEVDGVAASITSMTREELDRRVAADEADLFRDEPDMAYARDLRRFGATRPNIRGLDNNRVVQMVDGVRMADYYNGGGPTNFTMSSPLGAPVEFLKRVEVLRGPASSLYGSDAMGGVVGFLTLDAADLLGDEQGRAFRGGLQYTGVNEGLGGTVLGAGRGGNGVEWLLGYTETHSSETDNQGDVDTVAAARTAPNPQEVKDRGLLAKLAFTPAAGQRIKLTLEGREQDADVVIKRLSASLPKVTAQDGDDHSRRLRASAEWQHQPQGGWYDRLTTQVYHQTSETENFNRQTRTNTGATCSAAVGAGNNCFISQAFTFDQTSLGGGVQLEATRGIHFITVGVDLSRVEIEEKRDATVHNLTTNTTSKSLAGDTFPLRDFAPGYTDTVGLFVQDEISLMEGRLALTPALRYDWRKLQPEPDALSQGVLTAIGRQVAAQSDGAFSPKLAALWRFTPQWSVFGHLAGGFRAPNYDEVNGHFRNASQSYGVAPNPNLKPETSVGAELGLRYGGSGLRGQIAVYDNRYKDFIESVRLSCPADPNCIAGLTNTNMSLNLAKVRIYGAEVRAAWEIQPGWRLDGALAWTHGQDEELGRSLNSVEPARLTLGLARDAGVWGAETRLRAAQAVKRVDDCTDRACATNTAWYRPSGYGVVDVSAWWKPIKNARLTVAVSNLMDKKYWLWSDIRQADARNPAGVDFYSQPGRSLSASFDYRF